MPLIETKGAGSAQGFGQFARTGVATYIEDVFSTYLYTGTGSTQTITNGIDLSGKGGLVWIKERNAASSHFLFDTARGTGKRLLSNTTGAQGTDADTLTAFNSTGFSLGADAATWGVNRPNQITVSWTFRKQPKFFDVVTWTKGTNTNNRISHALGSVPGCIIIKSLSAASVWFVWHRTFSNQLRNYLALNTTDAVATAGADFWGSSGPTSTDFGINDAAFGGVGDQWVAYLFAHDAGGFGASGSDNVISCGSVTVTGTNQQVTLGWEPQFIILKQTDAVDTWRMYDNMRGMGVGGSSATLQPSSSNGETTDTYPYINATGFTMGTLTANTYIYIAIRRGPMKTPTTGTSVYSAVAYTGDGSTTRQISTTITPDLSMTEGRSSAYVPFWNSRLTGANLMYSSSTGAERLPSGFTDGGFTINTNSQAGIVMAAGSGATADNSNANTVTYINWNFRRAPGFFDVVCYTGTGVARTVTHNLGVAPELMIVKRRSGTSGWSTYNKDLPSPAATRLLFLDSTAAYDTTSAYWNNTNPTASVFSLGLSGDVNSSGDTYVAYLFATVAGVSKVFSYTGNGTSQTINCGFTGGARFVLIKRTDSTGDWYVWDSARGIVAGNDPHLSLNSTAAEVTTDDSVDTDSTGFVVNQLAATNVNVNTATYVGLAIA